jgi:beta-lactamase superfamily II metal-dependent hydrolase
MALLRTCGFLAVLFLVAREGVCQNAKPDGFPAATQSSTASSSNNEPEDCTCEPFTLWQLPNQTPTQMMSYVIRSHNGKVVVIDGGNAGDAPYLADFLKGLGNQVDAWIITHPHSDHFDALCEILKRPGSLEINAIYASMPDKAWIHEVASDSEKTSFDRFIETLAQAERKVTDLALGQEMEIDGVRIEVLGVKNPEIIRNPVNNSSLVLRVSDAAKSVLFLGDLGVEGGDKLLNSPMAKRLQSDYVQMAHHGQNGVNEAFYRRVDPTYCLWPAPEWLWENDNGGGKNSGPWRTLEVRAWMEKLPVKDHYVMFNGVQEIE